MSDISKLIKATQTLQDELGPVTYRELSEEVLNEAFKMVRNLRQISLARQARGETVIPGFKISLFTLEIQLNRSRHQYKVYQWINYPCGRAEHEAALKFQDEKPHLYNKEIEGQIYTIVAKALTATAQLLKPYIVLYVESEDYKKHYIELTQLMLHCAWKLRNDPEEPFRIKL